MGIKILDKINAEQTAKLAEKKFPDPFTGDKGETDALCAQKKEDFKKAGIEYTINQIDEYRACGINGIHLYALNKFDDVAYIAKEAGLLDLI
jgi:methylenetetrahydrofolate reductase (NADPH)